MTVEEYLAKMGDVILTATWSDAKADTMGFILSWECDGIGFGELTVQQCGDELEMDSETMSQAFVEAVVLKWLREAKKVG